jgi:4-hydroxy-tetrahydrodipicolinate synthase
MFSGMIVALVTPFTLSAEIDYAAFEKLVEWHIAEGTDGIVLCGTTGEAPTLQHAEQIELMRRGVEIANGRIPIIVGTGSNDTCTAVRRTQEAKAYGADGALVVLPYYNRPTPEGCFAHFAELAKVDFPLIVYHHPGRTGVRLPVEMLVKIAGLEQVVAIKEASGDVDYAIDVMQRTAKPLFSGDDVLTIPIMAAGGVGVISIVANVIPKEWGTLVARMRSLDLRGAKEVFDRYYALCKAMVLETNPQCVKYALHVLGKCESTMRLPLLEPREENKRQILSACMRKSDVVEVLSSLI